MPDTAEQTETKATHTPGPWVEFADRGQTVALMPVNRAGDICTFAKPYPSRADARLMNAAPDLLEALQEAQGHLGISRSYKIMGPIFEKIRAAIAKAEGR